MSRFRPTVPPHPVAAWISTLARWLLGGVLITAGAIKIVDLPASVESVRAYRMLPEPLAGLGGWGVPFLSLLLGLSLLAGAFTRIAAIVTAVLQVMFLIGVTSAAARGLSVDCGCFGGGGEVARGEEQYGLEIVRTLGLLLTAGWLIWRPHSRFSFDRPSGEDEEPSRTPEKQASWT